MSALTADALARLITKCSVSELLSHFKPVTSDEVAKLLKTAPVSTWLVKNCRPISNLSFCLKQLNDSLSHRLRREQLSTTTPPIIPNHPIVLNTALVHLYNDMMAIVDRGEVVLWCS